MARAAVYLPASTDRQAADHQVEVQHLALANGFEPALYEESAVKRRPVLRRLLADAQADAGQVVCVRSLGSLGRGLSSLRTYLHLARLGVRVLSLREPWTAIEGPGREPLIEAVAWVIQAEHDRHVARTKAGLVRARRLGKRIGRPRLPLSKLQAAAADVAGGMSQRGAARKRGVSEASLRAYLKRNRSDEAPANERAPVAGFQDHQVAAASVQTGAIA